MVLGCVALVVVGLPWSAAPSPPPGPLSILSDLISALDIDYVGLACVTIAPLVALIMTLMSKQKRDGLARRWAKWRRGRYASAATSDSDAELMMRRELLHATTLSTNHGKLMDLPDSPGREGPRSHRDNNADVSSRNGSGKAASAHHWLIEARQHIFERHLTSYEQEHLPMPTGQSASLYRREHLAEMPSDAWHSSRRPELTRTFEQQQKLREKLDASRQQRAAATMATSPSGSWLLACIRCLLCRQVPAAAAQQRALIASSDQAPAGKSAPGRLPRKRREPATAAEAAMETQIDQMKQ